MRIAYLYTALTSMGGVDRVLSYKANYLAEVFHYEIFIITDSQAGRSPVFPISPKVKLIDLETDFDEQYHYGIIKRTQCYFRLMKQYKWKLETTLETLHPDIVITTCGRELDFLNSIKTDYKIIGESHIAKKYCRNFHLMEEKGFPYKQVASFWRKRQENAIQKLDAFVVLTQNDADSWKVIRTSTIIPNPLPFYPSNSSTCSNKTIISVGRFSEQKGFDLLIETWKEVFNKHPDWNLNIFGEGQLHDELESLIKKNNLTRVIKLCPPTKDIMNEYMNSSIYVMSSRFEGFGMVLIEAMSCGVPCISFNCPCGPADVIRNYEDGILVESNNIEKLTDAICYLIEHEDKRKAFGAKALINVKRYYPEKIMSQWKDLFNSLMN